MDFAEMFSLGIPYIHPNDILSAVRLREIAAEIPARLGNLLPFFHHVLARLCDILPVVTLLFSHVLLLLLHILLLLAHFFASSGGCRGSALVRRSSSLTKPRAIAYISLSIL
jgi:hypothetical protein